MNRIILSAAIIAGCFSLMFTGTVPAQVASYRPKVGNPHVDFILPSIEDGAPIQLSSFRGKKVLLMHFASW